MLPPRLILRFTRAPGDVLMLTGLVRDLRRLLGKDAAIDVRTKFPSLWHNNPHLTTVRDDDDLATVVDFGGYGPPSAQDGDRLSVALGRSDASEKWHYARCFHHVFEQRTGIHVPCTESKPDLHLTQGEKAQPLIPGRYWIIVAGGKTDATCKIWYDHRYQEVVDRLRVWGLDCVQEGATHKELCRHTPLQRVRNMLGQTTIRQLIRNIYHAEGVICGCSLPMHIAGALEKPCVVLLGGREDPWFEAYVNDYAAFGPVAAPVRVPHRMLDTIGQLPCCQSAGCWKQRVIPLPDGKRYNSRLCEMPNWDVEQQPVAECMARLTASQVMDAAMSYYSEGLLPPLPCDRYWS